MAASSPFSVDPTQLALYAATMGGFGGQGGQGGMAGFDPSMFLDPRQRMRLQAAQGMMQEGVSTAPVHSPFGGLARLAGAILGRNMVGGYDNMFGSTPAAQPTGQGSTSFDDWGDMAFGKGTPERKVWDDKTDAQKTMWIYAHGDKVLEQRGTIEGQKARGGGYAPTDAQAAVNYYMQLPPEKQTSPQGVALAQALVKDGYLTNYNPKTGAATSTAAAGGQQDPTQIARQEAARTQAALPAQITMSNVNTQNAIAKSLATDTIEVTKIGPNGENLGKETVTKGQYLGQGYSPTGSGTLPGGGTYTAVPVGGAAAAPAPGAAAAAPGAASPTGAPPGPAATGPAPAAPPAPPTPALPSSPAAATAITPPPPPPPPAAAAAAPAPPPPPPPVQAAPPPPPPPQAGPPGPPPYGVPPPAAGPAPGAAPSPGGFGGRDNAGSIPQNRFLKAGPTPYGAPPMVGPPPAPPPPAPPAATAPGAPPQLQAPPPADKGPQVVPPPHVEVPQQDVITGPQDTLTVPGKGGQLGGSVPVPMVKPGSEGPPIPPAALAGGAIAGGDLRTGGAAPTAPAAGGAQAGGAGAGGGGITASATAAPAAPAPATTQPALEPGKKADRYGDDFGGHQAILERMALNRTGTVPPRDESVTGHVAADQNTVDAAKAGALESQKVEQAGDMITRYLPEAASGWNAESQNKAAEMFRKWKAPDWFIQGFLQTNPNNAEVLNKEFNVIAAAQANAQSSNAYAMAEDIKQANPHIDMGKAPIELMTNITKANAQYQQARAAKQAEWAGTQRAGITNTGQYNGLDSWDEPDGTHHPGFTEWADKHMPQKDYETMALALSDPKPFGAAMKDVWPKDGPAVARISKLIAQMPVGTPFWGPGGTPLQVTPEMKAAAGG